MMAAEDNDAALKVARRKRAIALAWVLGVIVAVFYVLTIVKLGPSVFNRDL